MIKTILIVLAFAFALHLCHYEVAAAQTGALRPTADSASADSASWFKDATSGTPCNGVGTNCYTSVAQGSGASCSTSGYVNAGTTNYIYSVTNSAKQGFTIDLSSIPNGATITSATIYICDHRAGAGATYTVYLTIDGTTQTSGSLTASSNTATERNSGALAFTKVKGAGSVAEMGVTKTNTTGAYIHNLAAVITYSLAGRRSQVIAAMWNGGAPPAGAGSWALDNGNTHSDASCTSCAGVTLSAPAGNAVVVQNFTPNSTVTAVASPYDVNAVFPLGFGGFADRLNTSLGTAPTWTQSSSDIGMAGAAAFTWSGSTISLVQQACHGTNCAAGATSCGNANSSCAVTVSATGAGHLIEVIVSYGDGSTQRTITGVTGGGSFTRCTTCSTFSAPLGVEHAYTLSSSAGDTTITVTLSGPPQYDRVINVREYSGS